MTFDVDGAVGWIRGAGDDIPLEWDVGWGPNDTPFPASIHTGTRIRCGESYGEPEPGNLPTGYHAPYQGIWTGTVQTGNLGTCCSAWNYPWTQRPEWSPCGGLDNTQYGGASVESWHPFVVPELPSGVSYLRVSIPIRGNWYTPGSYFFGSDSYPNPVAFGKTVQLRLSPTLPTSFEFGRLIGAVTLPSDGSYVWLRGSFYVTPDMVGKTYYIAPTQLVADHYTRGTVHCSIGLDVIDWPDSGGGDSWSVDYDGDDGFTWEWVVQGEPVIFVDGVDIDSLPIIEVGETPTVEIRTARTLLYGGQPADVDEDHVLLTTPVTVTSSIDDSNRISLLSPTVLPATQFTWKFRLSHTFNDRPQMAQGIAYSVREYSYDTVSGVAFLTFDQSIAEPYEEVVSEQENLTAIGGVSGDGWEVTTKGYGYATLRVGDWESGRFLVYNDRWYGLTMEYPSVTEVTFVLADYTSGDTLASISYPAAGARTVVRTGGRGVVFEPDIAVGFDEITLVGSFGDTSVETYVPPEPDIGWNFEYVKVENGQFTLEAQPVAGSVKVESFRTGLLDYPEDWEEADDTGLVYDVRTNDYILSVTYLVAMQSLENITSVARPQEQESQQYRRPNYL